MWTDTALKKSIKKSDFPTVDMHQNGLSDPDQHQNYDGPQH
jgi:hypothetical protein